MNVADYIQGYRGGRHWRYIIIHHSLTKDGSVNDWQAIRAWHTGKTGSANKRSAAYNPYIEKPDRDIGYHFGVEYVDGMLTTQVGRGLDMTGAHCVGKNTDGIGICLIGNYDLKEPGVDQYLMVAAICRDLMKKFGIGAFRVLPHRDFALKTCPGRLFNIEKLRNYISESTTKEEGYV